MQIHCPFCDHPILVRGAKPGVYRPRCPDCAQSYVLAIPQADQGTPRVGRTLDELKAIQTTAAPGGALPVIIEGLPTRGGAPALAATATAPSAPVRPPPPVSRPARSPVPVGRSPDLPSRGIDAAPTVAQPPPADPHATALADDLPDHLGGYAILRLLGRGGMGAVYLARQLSLDRLVAVKTIHPQWSTDPAFVSRFTREAFAAAQLVHHNVVQIHDIGEEDRTHFFSMEYVEGQSLADHLREHGRLDPEAAAGYVLQAARGLKFAHDHGMVHRDVKPHNLLLNAEGIVKVADLGLVKRAADHRLPGAADSPGEPGAMATRGSMGSPAYMPPEQSRDAEHVDARADIYSLGVSFYQLLTGRLPFIAETVSAMAAAHAAGQAPSPEQLNPRVPPALSQIVRKMMATKPDERYGSLDEVIPALEHFLGVTAGPFTPREEHARALEEAVQAFTGSASARVRRWVAITFLVLTLAVANVGLILNRPTLMSGGLALLVFTVLAYGLIAGMIHRTYLFTRVRQYVFGARAVEWLAAGVVFAGVVTLVVLMGQAWLYLGLLAAAALLAGGFALTLDRLVAKDRRPHIEAAQAMLKSMRLRGLEEEAVRRFVCRYSGPRWEAFYEALFGYEAKLFARQRWGLGDDGRPRKRHAPWRDGIVRWIDGRLHEREERRQRRHLQRIEERRLRAEGRSDEEARRQAEHAAGRILEGVAELRSTPRRSAVIIAQMLGRPLPKTLGDLDGDEDVPDSWKLSRESGRARLHHVAIGPMGRLFMGGALLLLATWWLRQSAMLPRFEEGVSIPRTLYLWATQDAHALDLPGIPGRIDRAVSSHAAALAGLLLMASALFRGTRQFWLLLPAVAVLLVGPQFLPRTLPMHPDAIAIAAGFALGVPALWLGRRS